MMTMRLKNVLSIPLICSFLLLVLCLPGTSHAERKVTKLTEDAIKDFIIQTADITSGKDGSMSQEKIKTYLNHHLDKGARFKSTMIYAIPGQPAQKNSMSLNKKEFIDSVNEGQKAVDEYETQVEVESVKISKDGKKATVQTASREQALMPITLEDGAVEEVPIEGNSNCNQIITLSKKGVIQMFSAQCTTTITFTPY